jgi:hypothetical protein
MQDHRSRWELCRVSIGDIKRGLFFSLLFDA